MILCIGLGVFFVCFVCLFVWVGEPQNLGVTHGSQTYGFDSAVLRVSFVFVRFVSGLSLFLGSLLFSDCLSVRVA